MVKDKRDVSVTLISLDDEWDFSINYALCNEANGIYWKLVADVLSTYEADEVWSFKCNYSIFVF